MSSPARKNLLAIVGRPNVGKSSLFNKLVRQRKSLVHDEPGVTRDRIFGKATWGENKFYVCDTGGFEPASLDNIKKQLVEQAELAIDEAGAIVFVVDAREGLHPVDADLIRRLRRAEKPFVVAANKCDLPMHDYLIEDFRKLGLNPEQLIAVSAEHSRGISDIMNFAITNLAASAHDIPDAIGFAIMGRPNVGKSSILNRLLGEQRSIVDERPGTTRDTVDAYVKFNGLQIRLIDTAGIRRHSKMLDRLESFSVLRSLSALEESHVAALVIDAKEGPTEGDLRVAGYAFEMRKPIIIVVNKWDLIADKDSKSTLRYTEELRMALRYIPYAPIIFVSALENQRVSKLMQMCLDLYIEANKRVSTSKVNNALRQILTTHTPPLTKSRSRKLKFFYATQVAKVPPRFVVFCSEPDEIRFSYKRFIENEFRKYFDFPHIPIAVHFKERGRKDLNELLAHSTAPAKLKGRDKIDPAEPFFTEELPDDVIEDIEADFNENYADIQFDDDEDSV